MSLRCRPADWQDPDDRQKLQSIRQQVFVEEQGVPVELEWDEHDDTALHFLAELDGNAVATARLILDDADTARIGRMAVLAGFRGRGIGRALLQTVIASAEQRGISCLQLYAQVQVIAFYERFGFEAQGEIFQDAGIPHRAMFRNCAKKEL